jgi:hypothetical protein
MEPHSRISDNIDIDHKTSRSICDEVGERLQQDLSLEASPLPPYLDRLIDELRKQDEMIAWRRPIIVHDKRRQLRRACVSRPTFLEAIAGPLPPRRLFATLVKNRIIVMNKTAFDISTGDR